MKDLQIVERALKESASAYEKDYHIEVRRRITSNMIEVVSEAEDERYKFIPTPIISEIVEISKTYSLNYLVNIYKNEKGNQCPRIVIY